VHQPNVVKLLVSGEAPSRAEVARVAPVDHQVALRIVLPAGVAPLAEGIVRIALRQQASVVGGGRDAAKVVLVPVLDLVQRDAADARRRCLSAGQRRQRPGGHQHADGLAAGAQVVPMAGLLLA